MSGSSPSDAHRIDELETAVRRLTGDVAQLRAEVRRLGGAAGPVAEGASRSTADAATGDDPALVRTSVWPYGGSAAVPPLDPRATAGAFARSRLTRPIDVEALVGRYGAMGLAVLTILLAAGSFLGWAIANERLGPGARVGLGAIVAAVVAASGWRLRRRGTRRFGNALLGLALALVHVDAWGAGPYLGVIPPAAALAVAAVASAALAALAWRSAEETLFVVGTGGALLAPFVTSAGTGTVPALLIYGWVVIATAVWALRGQAWRLASRLLVVGCAAYAAAGMDGAWTSGARRDQAAPALFALACAWAALLWGGAARPSALARPFAAVALLPVAAYTVFDGRVGDAVLLAAAGGATAFVTVRRSGDLPMGVAAAVLLPLAFLAAALLALPDASTVRGALLAVGWAAAAVVAAWDAPDARLRAAHLAAAGLASALAVALATAERRLPGVALLAAHAAVVSWAMTRARATLLALPALAALLLATGWAYDLLHARPAYGYTPFLTLPSLAALALVAAWCAFTWQASRGGAAGVAGVAGAPGDQAAERALVASLAPVAALAWGREELAFAYSPELSTFLLVLYYAAAGVLAIFVGRGRHLPIARRAGLALAIYAALKAVVQANELSSIGLRVGSYLAVGGFLLGVAYWYRAAGEGREHDADADQPEPAGRPIAGRDAGGSGRPGSPPAAGGGAPAPG